MEQQQEEFALLLAEKTIRNKMHALLDLNSINEVFPPTPNDAFKMIFSEEYKIDYTFISFEYENFEKLLNELVKLNNVNKIKKIPHIALVGIYEKSKHSEETVAKGKSFGLEYIIEKGSLNMETLSNLIISVKEAKSKNMSKEDKKKEKYSFIKNLGSGEFGVVDLYKDNENDRYVAVKKISLEGMSQAGKNKVKQEVDYMSSVKTPTIIEFYHSTVENDKRYIYLEFAKDGTLEQKIRDCKLKGNSFPTESILDWLIQVLIAVFSLNKNNMMHRDIKSENILITEDGVCKLSDLGISRVVDEQQKTLCGTPYYVSTEIASGLDYDYNSDIWSLGVVLYEVITGIKPFDKPNPSELYESIINDEYKPLPVDTDPKLIFLVNFMLRKNPKKRANLEDLLKQDFIFNRMTQIIEKNNWKDKIPHVDELYKLGEKLLTSYDLIKFISEENRQMIENAIKIFNDCTYTPYKKSFISSKIPNTINGDTIFTSLCDNFENMTVSERFKNLKNDIDSEEGVNFLNIMIENEVLIPVSDLKDGFDASPEHYYIFSFDNTQNEKNLTNFKIIKELNPPENTDLVTLSQYVLSEGMGLLEKIMSDNINKSDILSNENHLNFICGISLFQNYELLTLNQEDKIICLLNVYQIMLINNLLNLFNEKNSSEGLLSYFKNKIAINYGFKDIILSNLEIKHVIFRNNKKPPNNYVRLVSANDIKTQILPDYSDLRPILMLYDINDENLNDCRFKFQIFERKDFDNQLNEIVLNFITFFVTYTEDSIILPNFINQYIADFGTQVEFIKYIYKIYIANNEKQVIFRLKTPNEQNFHFLTKISMLLRKINNKTINIIIGE